jgi:hypothetical protein
MKVKAAGEDQVWAKLAQDGDLIIDLTALRGGR